MKEDIKILLKEAITMYEAKKDDDEKDDEDKKSEKSKDDDEKESFSDKEKKAHKEKFVSPGEQDDLEKMADVIYDMRLGGQLTKCVAGGDKKRTQQSKIRKMMMDDPYHDQGKTPKELAKKIIRCMTQLRKKITKV